MIFFLDLLIIFNEVDLVSFFCLIEIELCGHAG